MSNKRKKYKNEMRRRPKSDEIPRNPELAIIVVELAARMTVLIEACGSMKQAERYGLLNDLSDDQYEVALALVPVELGGEAVTPGGRSMWDLLHPALMQDPVTLADIQQYRYWIAIGQISEERQRDPLNDPSHVIQMPALPSVYAKKIEIIDEADGLHSKDNEVLISRSKSKD